MKRFALFDFDGTIAKGDSIISFLLYSWKHKKMTTKELFAALGGFGAYAFGKINDTQAKEKAIAFLKGKTQAEMAPFFESWYEQKLAKKIFAKGAEEIQKMQGEGYIVLVITASPDAYLAPFQKAYGIKDIIGTRVDKDENGVYSGHISGNNCRGIEKSLRLAEYLAAKGWGLDTQQSYAYGNSTHDEAMLYLVANPVLINPSRKLKKAFPNGQVKKWTERVKG